jgi:thiol:disulfide interchange protein DsbD
MDRIGHREMTIRQAIIAALLLAASAVLHAADPLRPEQAFRYAAAVEGSDIVVRWTIEPGYYLYRERMSYATKTAGAELGTPVLPEGLPYKDEFFGEMHIYRENALVRVPVLKLPPDGRLDLDIRSQGCADIGLCYPPQHWTTTVMAQAAPGRGTGLAGLLRRQDPDAPLPPEKVFHVSAELLDPTTLRVTWDIAEGYYLYRDSLKVVSTSPGVQLGAPALPPGTPKEDEYWGKTQVFHDEVAASIPVTGTAEPLQLKVSHQGCKEDSICYPPQTVLLTVSGVTAAAPAGVGPGPMVSEQDAFASRIAGGSLAVAMSLAFVAGLGLSLLPCCWPMIPILSGIIVGQGKDVTTGRAFALSVTYVLGMAVVYAGAGALAAAAGQQVQAALQTPWVIGGVATLFVAMALSMFGLYELALPASLATRLNAVSGNQKAGTFVGAAVMGALSSLVVSACVAPPLVGVLTYIANTGEVERGAAALFAMGVGMGVPLLVVGASGGRLLPRAGPWMNAVKAAFGFVMLGLAIWMLDRLLPDPLTLALYAALVFLAGVFLGAFQPLDAAARPARKLAKGLGLLAALYGAALLVGALAGGHDPFRPLEMLQAGGPGATKAEAGLGFRRIKTVADLEQAIAAAGAAGRPAMLDFYADWCTSCIEMERYTFTDAGVRATLANVVLLQADVTANDAEDQALLRRFGIFGPPTIVFFGADGAERDGYRVVGFKNAGDFAGHVRSAVGS